MLKIKKQIARIIQRIVITHTTPYRAEDIVINCKTSFVRSDGGPLPWKEGKRNYYHKDKLSAR